jgi:cytidylate kinase
MTERPIPVIAVDGPGGTGKGTLCLRLAIHLGWHFLDSGALYRLLALIALEKGIPWEDEAKLQAYAQVLNLRFACDREHASVSVWVDGRDVTEALRTEACANAASHIAALPGVRQALLDRQRAFRKPPGLVADGRDMGTVVFPDADLKLFLTASQNERANRRYKQLKEKGIDVNLEQVLRDIAERDARDSERIASPLKPALDALIIDTTDLSIEAVFEQVLALVKERGLRGR